MDIEETKKILYWRSKYNDKEMIINTYQKYKNLINIKNKYLDRLRKIGIKIILPSNIIKDLIEKEIKVYYC